MVFRATNVIPQRAYFQVKGAAANLKLNCASFITQLATSGATYSFLRDIYLTLKNANAQFDALKATPGIAQYAADQEDDQDYDVVAEFNAMQAAITAALGWMNTNVPTSVTALAPSAWTQGGALIATEFTPAQTANLRTSLQAVVAVIE